MRTKKFYTVKFSKTESGYTLSLSDGSYEKSFDTERDAREFYGKEIEFAKRNYKTADDLDYVATDDEYARHAVTLDIWESETDEDGYAESDYIESSEIFWVEA